MKQNQSQAQNKCLPNCHEVQFTSSEILEKLDVDEFCDPNLYGLPGGNFNAAYKRSEERTMMIKIKWHFLYNVELFEKMRRIKEAEKVHGQTPNVNLEGILKEFCYELVRKDLAKVSVMFERNKYLQTSTSVRMAFADKLGAIGKCPPFNKNV